MRQMLSMFDGCSIVVGFVNGFETAECDASVQSSKQPVVDGMVSIERSRRLGNLGLLLALRTMGCVLQTVDVLFRCTNLIGQIVQGFVHDDRKLVADEQREWLTDDRVGWTRKWPCLPRR